MSCCYKKLDVHNPWELRIGCLIPQVVKLWGETGGSETPASRSFYSRFPPPSKGVPASLFYLYCKMLRSIAKFFSFSPGSRHLGNPASRPFSSCLPCPSRPLLSRAPAPRPPPLNCCNMNCRSGFQPWLGHCIVIFGKASYSHGASLHPGI